MPNSEQPQPNTTRQMLDELDALMERMLALPVNELEDSPHAEPVPIQAQAVLDLPPPPPLPEAPLRRPLPEPAVPPAPAKVVGARITASYTLPELDEGTEKAPPRRSEPEVSHTWPPVDEPLPPLHELMPLIVPAVSREKEAQRPAQRSWTGLALLPLVWINQTFDTATFWMGGTGQSLRSSRGRKLIGSTGVALLFLAGVWWLHDWLGWTWFGDPLE